MDIILEDVFQLAAGKQEDGSPMSGSALSVLAMTETEKVLTKEYIDLNSPLEIHSSGGCVVVAMDLNDSSAFTKAAKIAMSWLSDEDTSDFLSLTVVPMYLHGQLSIIFRDMVYCDFYEKNPDTFRLIFAFDNEKTILYGSDEIDYQKICDELDAHFNTKQKEIDQELDRLEQKQKDYETKLLNLDFGLDLDNLDIDSNTEEHPIGYHNVRFKKEDKENEKK